MVHTIEAAAPVRTTWIQRHPLTAFFGWFFTVGQAFAFAPLVLDTGVPDQIFIIGSTLVGLLLPALVLTRIVDGPEALRRMVRSFVDWRVSLRWYALALLVVPAVSVGLGVLLLGAPEDVPATLAGVFLAQLALTLIPNNWAEEGVWSGFVQARMQRRYGPVLAAVIVGPLFALQHVSLAVGNPPMLVVILMAGLAVVAIPYRFLTGLVWNRTGSLLLLGLLHAAGNAAAPGAGFGGGGVLRHLYPADWTTVGVFHLLAFFIVGLVVVAVTKGRLGRSTTTTTEEHTK
jgi:membrane protease YdiL (CAAX protease family)